MRNCATGPRSRSCASIPSRLKGTGRPGKELAGKMLKIRILDKNNRQEKVSLNIPLALADLALKSLSAEQKRALQKKGYDLDEILDQLTAQGLEDRYPG